jgi:hypothetical protein
VIPLKSARRRILVSVDAEEEAQSIGLKSAEQTQVETQRAGGVRRLVPRELDAEALEDNVSEFLESIEGILSKAPEVIGNFRIREFTVTAEITAEGKLSLVAVGGGMAATGGLTFTFERVAETPTT